MKGLRILHAVRSDGFAGVERHVSTLATAQSAAGHEVAVIGGNAGAMRAALADSSIRFQSAATVLQVARSIDALGGSDILHVHMTAAEIAAVAAIRRWNVRAVTTRHFGGTRGSSTGARLFAPLIRARLAGQIAISRHVARLVDGPSTVVHPGVTSRQDGLRATDRTRSALVAQRLEPEKNTDVALRAFAASGLPTQGWSLDVAGSGSQLASLQELARRLGVDDNVRFLGHRSDVASLMDHAGILIAPCAVEGLGLTVLEAMAAGLPVVAAAAGGHLETVAGAPSAALFTPHDASEAGELLGALAHDGRRRDAYARELQSIQRTSFTLQAQVRATDAVYRSVL
ncbi:glycosyltransferase family 4 protein [Raineyella fluvialis]|uniref:Glycosyltransferase n=1 Tax=Raineyella fluvialis TaxID=2662261 RepID=A0A5Q2FFJ1_9ACTN|nr:glycosyltransferase family 4 protein [Raineyella fluvialis]QGF23883.1 glycosyltransferase [Raineyella fluvialis]